MTFGGVPGMAAALLFSGVDGVAAAPADLLAMRESRAYRPSRSLDAAVEELQRRSGDQFDPVCVDALLDALGKVRREREVA